MIAPAASTIEMANDQLKSPDTFAVDAWVLPDQKEELLTAVPGASEDFVNGYQLGIQTARVQLSQMPGAILHKVSI